MSTTTTTAAATNRWYLSAAPIARALVHLCVPMAAAMVVSALYNVINAGFIGAQHDTSLLAPLDEDERDTLRRLLQKVTAELAPPTR